MYNKLSNSASKIEIESQFKTCFRYPEIFKPTPLIDGAKESNLSLITMEQPDAISNGIWGMLPPTYQGDWADFYKVKNTLNLNIESINNSSWEIDALLHNRCLIIVTGFYTYLIEEGALTPYYVYAASQKPFCVAGIYTNLEDGFITVSLLLKQADSFINKIQSISNLMPCIVNPKTYRSWINPDNFLESSLRVLSTKSNIDLSSTSDIRDISEYSPN